MTSWMRKIRGVFRMGSVSGLLGGSAGIVAGATIGMLEAGGIGTGAVAGALDWMWTLGPGFAGFGFLVGTGFATTLSLFDGRRTLAELSSRRAAVWGGLAGFAILPPVLVALSSGAMSVLPALVAGGAFGGVTALLGAGVVKAARRDHLLSDDVFADPVLPAGH